jgi:predicted XRE-type DNA-binding protein
MLSVSQYRVANLTPYQETLMQKQAQKTPRTAPAIVAKDALAKEIGRVITDRGMTQNQVSRLTGEQQSQISLVVTRKLHGISVSRLFRILNGLGRDIEIRIAGSKRGRGKVRLNVSPT